MKFRPQRELLVDSMAEVVELQDFRALTGHLTKLGFLPAGLAKIAVRPYCYDDRNGWKTYLVTVDGQAVGFTNGPASTGNGQ